MIEIALPFSAKFVRFLESLQPLDYLFVTPSLPYTGIERQIEHVIQAVRSSHRNSKCLVLVTRPLSSKLPLRLEGKVDILSLPKDIDATPLNETRPHLFELVQRLNPRKLLIFESTLGWHLAESKSQTFMPRTDFYAVGFSDFKGPRGAVPSLASLHLPNCMNKIDGVFCDNQTFARELKKRFEFNRVFVTLTPVDQKLVSISRKHKPRKLSKTSKVLWASRLEHQKNPSLVEKLAILHPELEFHLYGPTKVELEGKVREASEIIGSTGNLRLLGPYAGFESLPLHEYDCFLYTGTWDGIPNVILEMAAYGLPIVTSDSGGIPELIGPNTGYLCKNIEQFVESIAEIRANPREALHRASRLQKLVKRKHSFSRFFEELQAAKFLELN